MSKQIVAMNLALEALENLPEMCGIEEAITAIRDALMSVPDGAQSRSDEEQPVQQKPVAVVADHPERIDWLRDEPPDGTLLYTSPPASKPWVGLTEEDRLDIWKKSSSIDGAINATASKLREKNNG